MKYRARRRWRHFKYKLLEIFFGKQELRKFLDIDKLDFVDAVKLTAINSTMILSPREHDYFTKDADVKYGIKYALARRMAETLAKHIEISEIMDVDDNTYTVMGTITLAERKEE